MIPPPGATILREPTPIFNTPVVCNDPIFIEPVVVVPANSSVLETDVGSILVDFIPPFAVKSSDTVNKPDTVVVTKVFPIVIAVLLAVVPSNKVPADPL